MPSASAINNNKLEKRSSISSVQGGLGGGNGGSSNNNGGSVQQSASAGNVAESAANSKNSSSNNNNDLINNKNLKAVTSVGGMGVSSSATTLISVASNDALNPMKQTLVTIEHKIRNLEKRKTKLESYRAIQATGKELSADQKAAVAKYDAVMATLEFARDLSKQMVQFSKDAEKEQKKQLRKENIAKAYAETAKIREVLVIQNVLSCFTDESVRSDFLAGDNGAVKLETGDLEAIEKFCIDIQTRRPETNDDVSFNNSAQKAAELFSMTIDARPKQYGEVTFEKLRSLFNQIQECGYLDKIYLTNDQLNTSNVNDDDVNAAQLDLDDGSVPTAGNSLEDGMDKLHLEQVGCNQVVVEQGIIGREESEVPVGGVMIAQQQPLLVDGQMQQQQMLSTQPQQQMQQVVTPTNVTFVPQQSQQQQQQPPPPQQQLSGNTTPVHMLYATNNPPLQMPPQTGAGGAMLPPPPPQVIAAAAQQRQIMSSPVGGLPAANVVGPGQLPPNMTSMHGGPAPQAVTAQYGGPTTVRAVEQAYFKQHQQQHHHQQFMQQQQLRPLADVIGGGSFYFLQDSELDSPDVNSAVGAHPVAGVVYDQQLPQQQQILPPTQQQLLGNHVEELQQLQPQQQQQQQQQQTIQTQTFTNQSFPPVQQQPPNLVSNTPSPMFQQQQPQKQLYSPVATIQQQQQQQQQLQDNNLQQQLLLPSQGRDSIRTILPGPQAELPPQAFSMQIDGTQHPNAAFPYDKNVVVALNYEQQLKHQLAAATAMKEQEQHQQQHHTQLNAEEPTEWVDARSNNNIQTSNAATPNTLNTVLKSASSSIAIIDAATPTNKWSTEMNALSTPTTPNATPNSRNKNDWSSTASNRDNGGTAGGYADAAGNSGVPESNHWNSQQDNGANSGGYGGRRSGGGYHQRRGGDDRRDDRERGRGNNVGGGSGGGGYRARNYGNATQQNGRNSGGGNNSSVYFRNNDHSSATGSGGGGGGASGGGSTANNYYQNGGNNIYQTDKMRYDSGGGGGGGNYRGSRGNANQRGNASATRPMGRNAGGGNSANTGGSYVNPRQANRMPMSLENKN